MEMETIEKDVHVVLSTLKIDGNNVRITTQLDRKLYLAVNKVLERIGGKWNRKAKLHVFDDDPTERLNNVIECGVLDPKVKTGYFPTPSKIIDKMIELADLKGVQSILEPSAGQGHIAEKILRYVRDRDYGYEIIICETLPENVRILEEIGWDVEGNFFDYANYCNKFDITFDRILMNPPFEFQSDILHVSTAFNLLAPNGILVAIMSTGVTFRENKKTNEFRENVMKPHQTYLEHLPSGTFKEFGTMVNTIILRLQKSRTSSLKTGV